MIKPRGLLLDVEGVLVADKRYQAVETAVEFVARARAAGCPVRAITNNTTDDRATIVEKLARAGFDLTLDEVHTCTSAAVERLRLLGARRCLVLGTATLRKIFTDAGFEVVDDAQVDAVVVGLHTELTYDDLRFACDAIISHTAAFLTLHRNRLYGDASGRRAPSVGPITAAIEYAAQVEAVVIGKPSPDYFQQALDALGLAPTDVLLVSDDPLTDLAGGKRMGMHAAFTLSGKYGDDSVLEQIPTNERPDVTVPRIGDLLTTGAVAFS